MAADSEDYTTFSCRFGAFKWKVLPSRDLPVDQPRGSALSMMCERSTLVCRLKGHQLWVAEQNQLRLDLMEEVHDQRAVGHADVARTLKMRQL